MQDRPSSIKLNFESLILYSVIHLDIIIEKGLRNVEIEVVVIEFYRTYLNNSQHYKHIVNVVSLILILLVYKILLFLPF